LNIQLAEQPRMSTSMISQPTTTQAQRTHQKRHFEINASPFTPIERVRLRENEGGKSDCHELRVFVNPRRFPEQRREHRRCQSNEGVEVDRKHYLGALDEVGNQFGGADNLRFTQILRQRLE
jgi:hypothetical protein